MAIATSVRTKEQAESLGIPLQTLGTPESCYSDLDVAIDGADNVDPDLNLVKGGLVEPCFAKRWSARTTRVPPA